jgi:RNA polymerase sigma-32 factor
MAAETPEFPEESRSRAVVTLPPAESGLPAPYDPLARYIHEIRRFPPLTRDEELQLARRHRDHKDPEATTRLITAHLMLVVKLALMYRRAIRNVMDLIQEGNIGLLEALKRYDPEQGVRFPTYAAWWIKAYILKFLLDNARMVRIGTTNARRKLLYNLRRERDKLIQQGIAPTPKLLAEKFGVPETDVVEVAEAISGRDISVDAPVTEDGSATVGDVMATPGPSVEEAVARDEVRERIAAAIREFRAELGERDQLLLDLRLTAYEPATLQEIGDRIGVTREAIRQSENRLKDRLAQFLRRRLGEDTILRFTGRR